MSDLNHENSYNKKNVSHLVCFDTTSDIHKLKCGSHQHLDASSHPLSAPNCVLNCEKLAAETYATVHNDFASSTAFGICDIFQKRLSFIAYKFGLFLKLRNLLRVSNATDRIVRS
jgi:hypothetical protein